MTTTINSNWEEEWRKLSRRMEAWGASADFLLRHLDRMGSQVETANKAVAHEANEILAGIEKMELPPSLRASVEQVKTRLGSAYTVSQGERLVAIRWMVLAALRVPLDDALGRSEESRRRLVDRAFVHLNRTLVVDDAVRERWVEALAHETRCEQLGALHLLSHGIYAFKADASSGRTDLILGEPLEITEEVRASEAMVLTEWKVVREGDDALRKAREGRVQADRYARVELAGFELRAHRYVVVVSATAIELPIPETASGITYHYVNIAIQRPSPSVESRAT